MKEQDIETMGLVKFLDALLAAPTETSRVDDDLATQLVGQLHRRLALRDSFRLRR